MLTVIRPQICFDKVYRCFHLTNPDVLDVSVIVAAAVHVMIP
jgi:hypothetical protein